MPALRLRRSANPRASVLVRGLVLALAVALLVTGCGGDDAKPEAAGDPTAVVEPDSSPEPRNDEPAPDPRYEPPPAPSYEPAPVPSYEPAPDPGYQAPKVGQCYRLSDAQSRASVVSRPKVKCGGKHTTVVSHVGYLPKPVTPRTPLAKRQALGKRLCEPAYRRYVGGTVADRATSLLTWTLFTPGQAQLQRGARWVRCDVLARSGDQLVPLPEGRPLLEQGVPEQLRICQDDTGADVSCSQPHAFRVEAVYQASGGYPSAPAYTPVARTRCQELMKKFGGYWQPPSRRGWNGGDRFVRCLSATTAATPPA